MDGWDDGYWMNGQMDDKVGVNYTKMQLITIKITFSQLQKCDLTNYNYIYNYS